MTNFYEKYKKLRQDQKIELVDIESRTKINIKYLQAIETGDFDRLDVCFGFAARRRIGACGNEDQTRGQ